jgi:hypothetical protein
MPEQWGSRWKAGLAAFALVASMVPAAAYAGVPDVAQSFYVPQRGSVGTPVEGTAAATVFRTCPNNDAFSFGGSGTGALNNGRIRVIVRDVNGVGIPGIAAADICVLFNGGTSIQGFSGVGADSVVATNGTQTNGLCPNVRCIQADGPTDAVGSTYITFRGNDGITPGVSIRDPQRKWGHFDTDIPVFALGFKLAGRLSSTQVTTTPAYVLRVKNVDVALGLNNTVGAAEVVTGVDVSTVVGALTTNPPLKYWYDVDNNNVVSGIDVTTVVGHLNHSCVNILTP